MSFLAPVNGVGLGSSISCALIPLFNNQQGVKCWGLGKYTGAGVQLPNWKTFGLSASDMGDNLPFVNLGSPTYYAQSISCGYDYCCVGIIDILDRNAPNIDFAKQSLKCFGSNSKGQLGIGISNTEKIYDSNSGTWYDIPLIIGDGIGEMGLKLPFVNLGKEVTALKFSCGAEHACVLTNSQQVKCWGDNSEGQLGMESNRPMIGVQNSQMGDNLKPIDLSSTIKVVLDVQAGGKFSCALLENKRMKCWGNNQFGQIGIGSFDQGFGLNKHEMGDDLPFVDLGSNFLVSSFSVGYSHTCAVMEGNQNLKCWGSGGNGQLGNGNIFNIGNMKSSIGDNLPFVNLGSNLPAISGLSLGMAFTCVSFEKSSAKCFGVNTNAQLGIGVMSGSFGDDPSELGNNISFLQLGSELIVKNIWSGTHHSCASFVGKPSIKCWGSNSVGKLGQGVTRSTVGDNLADMGDQLPFSNLATLKTSKAPTRSPSSPPTVYIPCAAIIDKESCLARPYCEWKRDKTSKNKKPVCLDGPPVPKCSDFLTASTCSAKQNRPFCKWDKGSTLCVPIDNR